jgi:exosortase/archaeosortase family protein
MAARRKKQKAEKSNSQAGPASPFFGMRYPLMVAAVAAPLFAIYFYPYAEGGVMSAAVQSYLAAYAKTVGIVVSKLDPGAAVDWTTIHGPLFSMRIVRTCDAMEVNILLVAALAAFPMPLWRRFVAILVSMFLVVLMNVGRLCMLYHVGAHAPSWFERTHQTLAPLFMVAGALAVFLVATHQTQRGSSGNPVREVAVTGRAGTAVCVAKPWLSMPGGRGVQDSLSGPWSAIKASSIRNH